MQYSFNITLRNKSEEETQTNKLLIVLPWFLMHINLLLYSAAAHIKYKPINSDIWKSTSSIWPTFTFAFPVLNNDILSQPIFHVYSWLVLNCTVCRHFHCVAVTAGDFLCASDNNDFITRWLRDSSAFSLIFFITAQLHINVTSTSPYSTIHSCHTVQFITVIHYNT